MDPLNIAEKILKLVLKIKDAIETVHHNKRLCSTIQENVETIGDILSSADKNTKIMSPSMCRPLHNLGKALETALNLIRDCQEKSTVARLLTADQMSEKLQDANQTIMNSMGIAHFAISSLQPAPSMVTLTPSPDVATRGERKKEIGKGKKHEEVQSDGEKQREKKDVEEKKDAERKNEIGKGKKHKATQNDGEKRREMENVEEKRDAERKKEIEKGKKHKDTQNDREKRRENEDVEQKIYGERKIENGKGNKNKETQDNVEEKRDGPGLVRPKDSSVADPYDSSRKEEKEWYYSCSSSCSVSQLKAMIGYLLEKYIIKQQGDYIMYEVKLSDGTHVVVHRIERFGAARARAEHEIRVRGTVKLEHINILKCLGYFSHGGFLYLVDESFGILSSHIYGNTSKGKELSWHQCSHIILDIADGVVYLHERGVIHMSLHPRKISISPECVAKISYFFISEILTQSVQEGVVISKKMKRGFEPPEYKSHGRYSVKTDVYSYGVLLLELITGQMCNQGGDNYDSLTTWVLQHALANNTKRCIQPRLTDAADGPQIEDIKRCIRIALLCVEKDPARRPTMHDVRGWLRNKNQDLPGNWTIQKPAYITKRT